MKRVIELDEYQLEHCKRHVKEKYANLLEENIVNGEPLDCVLDKIRAEINAEMEKDYGHDIVTAQGIRTGYLSTLSIIDKYKESEDKK